MADVAHSPYVCNAGRLLAPPTRARGRATVTLRNPLGQVGFGCFAAAAVAVVHARVRESGSD